MPPAGRSRLLTIKPLHLAKMAKSEVMRLWAPQVGALVSVAAARLAVWEEGRPGWLMGGLASLQIAYTFILDRFWVM